MSQIFMSCGHTRHCLEHNLFKGAHGPRQHQCERACAVHCRLTKNPRTGYGFRSSRFEAELAPFTIATAPPLHWLKLGARMRAEDDLYRESKGLPVQDDGHWYFSIRIDQPARKGHGPMLNCTACPCMTTEDDLLPFLADEMGEPAWTIADRRYCYHEVAPLFHLFVFDVTSAPPLFTRIRPQRVDPFAETKRVATIIAPASNAATEYIDQAEHETNELLESSTDMMTEFSPHQPTRVAFHLRTAAEYGTAVCANLGECLVARRRILLRVLETHPFLPYSRPCCVCVRSKKKIDGHRRTGT